MLDVRFRDGGYTQLFLIHFLLTLSTETIKLSSFPYLRILFTPNGFGTLQPFTRDRSIRISLLAEPQE